MQKRSPKKNHCCEGNHKISQSQVRIHIAWSVGEGNVFRSFFGYICGNCCVFCLFIIQYLIFLSGLYFRLHDRKCSKFVTNFRYEYRQVKSKRSARTSRHILEVKYGQKFK